MKKFLINIVVFFFVFGLFHLLCAFLADGKFDDHYKRFTSKKQSSLILGTSRAAQGIIPAEIKDGLQMDRGMYNYAFTLFSSPYGEVYYNSIVNKLDEKSQNGVFILAVDPWNISVRQHQIDLEQPDEKSALYGMTSVNSKPNFQFLMKKYNRGWGNILLRKIEPSVIGAMNPSGKTGGSWYEIQDDGWLEVHTTSEPKQVEKKLRSKVKQYRESIEDRSISNDRIAYLRKTVQLLKNHGEVYLVRLPVHPQMMDVEMEYCKDLDGLIQEEIQLSDGYYDMSDLNGEMSYTDGNHLHKESSKRVSKLVAEFIKNQRSER